MTFEKQSYRVWIIVASDKGFMGERKDLSGPIVREMIIDAGFTSAGFSLLPDDQSGLENEMKRICDNELADLIITSGGTGFSQQDSMPEATLAVAERLVPGIADAMRAGAMVINKNAMLSRAVSVIRGKTLIVNLPGSPKVIRDNLKCIIGELQTGLDILTGRETEFTTQ